MGLAVNPNRQNLRVTTGCAADEIHIYGSEVLDIQRIHNLSTRKLHTILPFFAQD
jgi:hypothetical protein